MAASEPTTSLTTLATTTTLPTTTTSTVIDPCAEAMDETFASFDAVLDNVDDDPLGFIDSGASDKITDLFESLGTSIAEGCGLEGSTQAISDLVLYLSNEQAIREPLTGNVIDGMLEGLCEAFPVELTISARTVCATTG
jgi:hypothetical protein